MVFSGILFCFCCIKHSFRKKIETYEQMFRSCSRHKDTSSENIKLITIDRVEELYYFIENIYKHNKKLTIQS